MLPANQIEEFFHQLYFKEELTNRFDFWIADIYGLYIFSFVCLKMLSANQIARFMNQPYLKSNCVSQRDFSYADID